MIIDLDAIPDDPRAGIPDAELLDFYHDVLDNFQWTVQIRDSLNPDGSRMPTVVVALDMKVIPTYIDEHGSTQMDRGAKYVRRVILTPHAAKLMCKKFLAADDVLEEAIAEVAAAESGFE